MVHAFPCIAPGLCRGAEIIMIPSPENSGYVGEREVESGASEYNAHAFLIQQILNRISTATLVRVEAVTNEGGVAPVGFVDVHPLINQVDGLRKATPHTVIFGVPYFRLQGGTDAIILDPKIGDIGIAIFADHDISTVKATRDESNPGSGRRFDMADGLYIGGVLNGTPENYVQFSEAGITVVSTVQVKVSAPDVVVHADHSYAQDVHGLGTRTTYVGGSDFQVDSYASGAHITSTEHGYNPPEIP